MVSHGGDPDFLPAPTSKFISSLLDVSRRIFEGVGICFRKKRNDFAKLLRSGHCKIEIFPVRENESNIERIMPFQSRSFVFPGDQLINGFILMKKSLPEKWLSRIEIFAISEEQGSVITERVTQTQ